MERTYRALLDWNYSAITVADPQWQHQKRHLGRQHRSQNRIPNNADASHFYKGHVTFVLQKNHTQRCHDHLDHLYRSMFSPFAEQLCFWGVVVHFGMPVLVQTHMEMCFIWMHLLIVFTCCTVCNTSSEMHYKLWISCVLYLKGNWSAWGAHHVNHMFVFTKPFLANSFFTYILF